MHEKIAEKFLSMKWDKNYLTKLNASIGQLTEDNIISVLDNVFPEWTFNITLMSSNGERIAGTLFLPGRCYDGTGSNEWSAICNIISKLTTNVNTVSNQETASQSNASDTPKTTTASVMQQLQSIKSNASQNAKEAPKNDAEDIFDELMGGNDKPKEEKPEYIEYGTKEAEENEKQFWSQINKSEEDPLKTPTAEEVNPNHVIMLQKWDAETGKMLKEWTQQHNVTTKEQVSSWLKRYCGLEYDYFDPAWTKKFIDWTNALRELQTY